MTRQDAKPSLLQRLEEIPACMKYAYYQLPDGSELREQVRVVLMAVFWNAEQVTPMAVLYPLEFDGDGIGGPCQEVSNFIRFDCGDEACAKCYPNT